MKTLSKIQKIYKAVGVLARIAEYACFLYAICALAAAIVACAAGESSLAGQIRAHMNCETRQQVLATLFSDAAFAAANGLLALYVSRYARGACRRHALHRARRGRNARARRSRHRAAACDFNCERNPAQIVRRGAAERHRRRPVGGDRRGASARLPAPAQRRGTDGGSALNERNTRIARRAEREGEKHGYFLIL